MSVDWSDFDTDTVSITSETTHADGTTSALAIYNGLADFQPRTGSTITDPAGQLQMVDALLLIDPDASNALPAIQIVDGGPTFVATVNGMRYDVIFAVTRQMAPRHMTLHLKRGPQRFTETRP
jgi:hypothetical protein